MHTFLRTFVYPHINHPDTVIEWKLNAFNKIFTLGIIPLIVPLLIIMAVLHVWIMFSVMLVVFFILIQSSYLARKGHLALPVNLTMVATIGSNLCFLLLYRNEDGLYLTVLMIIVTGIFIGSYSAFIWALVQAVIVGTIAIVLPEFTLLPQGPGYFSMTASHPIHLRHCSTIIFLYFASVLLSVLFQRHFNDLLKKVRTHEEDKRHLESNLLEAQKLESLGLLASGIAHDFNNALTTITCCSNLIHKKIPDDQEINNYTSNISKMCNIINASTSGLLSFTRPSTNEMIAINIHEVIESMEWLLKLMLRKEIDVIFELNAKKTTINGNFAKLQNIVMNLANNARQAMTGRGTFTIATRNSLENDPITTQPDKLSEFIIVSVSDTGKGMDQETLNNLFQPFYTTKGMQGNGLGLARVAELLTLHKAQRHVSSAPGKGTTFELLFPLLATENSGMAI